MDRLLQLSNDLRLSDCTDISHTLDLMKDIATILSKDYTDRSLFGKGYFRNTDLNSLKERRDTFLEQFTPILTKLQYKRIGRVKELATELENLDCENNDEVISLMGTISYIMYSDIDNPTLFERWFTQDIRYVIRGDGTGLSLGTWYLYDESKDLLLELNTDTLKVHRKEFLSQLKGALSEWKNYKI